MKVIVSREKYPKFIYRNYGYRMEGGNLKISFFFEIPPDIKFRPEIIIKNVTRTLLVTKNVTRSVLDNLVFHLGLIEMLSYWKTTCSPEIIIEAGYLDKNQTSWWRGLIIKGMGQFFYENKIDWRQSNFLRVSVSSSSDLKQECLRSELKHEYLVPMGGGRDSIVTLEKFRKSRKKINCFVVNPTKATEDVLKTAGIKNPIIVERKIDPKLLLLNKSGFLNGHTPFTALLSFLSVFCAVLFGYKNIAFSNEKSANEGNISYLGRIINHQWSKSSEFEKMFQYYSQKYLVKNINYFSYLRKYGELEISKMFVQYPKYFPVFSSCNVGKKTGKKWCGSCPKCLFVYLTLCPYLAEKQLIKIFDKNLLKDKSLLPTLRNLVGKGKHKPFECVGTYNESRNALKLCLKKAATRR